MVLPKYVFFSEKGERNIWKPYLLYSWANPFLAGKPTSAAKPQRSQMIARQGHQIVENLKSLYRLPQGWSFFAWVKSWRSTQRVDNILHSFPFFVELNPSTFHIWRSIITWSISCAAIPSKVPTKWRPSINIKLETNTRWSRENWKSQW